MRLQTARDLRSGILRVNRDSVRALLPAEKSASKSHLGLTFGLVAVVIALVGLFFVAYHRTGSASTFQFQQITSLAGEESSPNLSPDGKDLIYAAAREGHWSIYLQRVGGAAAVDLTRDSSDDATQPALSRDGGHVAFRSDRGGGGLFVMERTGENPRRIAANGYFPAWSPDGQQIVCSSSDFFIPSVRVQRLSTLSVIDLATGGQRELPTGGDAIQPNWSPHGYRIAYWAIADGGHRALFTTQSSGPPDSVKLTDGSFVDWNPIWSPTGAFIYFLSDRGGSMNVWRIAIDERSGKPMGGPEPLTVPALYVSGLALSADGTDFVYTQMTQRIKLAVMGFDPVRRTVVGTPQVISGAQTVSNFSLSPDGSRLVFDTIGDATEDIKIMNADGSGIRRLTSDSGRNRVPAWSPKSDEIVFYSDRTGHYEDWLVNADGGALRRISATKNEMQAALWFPDGSRILAGSNGAPVILNPRDASPGDGPIAPGLEALRQADFQAWTSTPAGLAAIVDIRSGPTAPDIGIYTPSQSKLELTGLSGRSSLWLRGVPAKDASRYFLFIRVGRMFLYDREMQQETKIFSITPGRFYHVAMSPDGHNLFFSQTIRDGDIWLAHPK